MDIKFNMTTKQKVVFSCLQAAHAQDFLLVIPIDELSQHMPVVEYHNILRYRLIITLFPFDEVCPICCKACLNTFGEHTIHCREIPSFKYQHDLVMDDFFDIFQRVGVSVMKNASRNFLTDPYEGISTLSATNVLVYE
ncbi:unnamed protein product [Lathyrus sativus]|nr:unnamed protein product [Lathyrus sativus]